MATQVVIDETSGVIDINKRSVLLMVELAKPGNRRSVKSSRVEVDADPDAIKVSKELLDSPHLKAIEKLDGSIRRKLYTLCVPSKGMLKAGVYRLPDALISRVQETLEAFYAARTSLIAQFVEAYPTQVEDAQDRLRALYREEDYKPTGAMEAAFRFRWRYMVMDVPEKLGEISQRMMAEEKRKAAEAAVREAQEIRETLRQGFAALLDHATEKLAVGRGGKPVIFRDSLVENMVTFLSDFNARNIVGDAELAEMVDKARAVLKGVNNAQLLRDDATMRERVQKSFAAIRGEMDDALMLKPRRGISFDEVV